MTVMSTRPHSPFLEPTWPLRPKRRMPGKTAGMDLSRTLAEEVSSGFLYLHSLPASSQPSP